MLRSRTRREVQPAALRVAQAVASGDLPQTRQSRLDLQDFGGVHAVVAAQFAVGQRPRADQRHLARDHVPQLRQLVDRVAAAEAREADWSRADRPGFARRTANRPRCVRSSRAPRRFAALFHIVRSFSIHSVRSAASRPAGARSAANVRRASVTTAQNHEQHRRASSSRNSAAARSQNSSDLRTEIVDRDILVENRDGGQSDTHPPA